LCGDAIGASLVRCALSRYVGTLIVRSRNDRTLSYKTPTMFLPTAVFKLTDFFLAVQFFTKWGIPLWLMHFIGVCLNSRAPSGCWCRAPGHVRFDNRGRFRS